jgi:hypothetical protein
MRDIRVTVKGLSPLLMNRFTEEAAASLNGLRPVTSGQKPKPLEVATNAAYRDEKGYLIWPGSNILSSLIAAGQFHRMGRSKVTTQKSSLVPAAMAVTDLEVGPTEDGKKTKRFEVDSRRGVNPSTGNACMIIRARVDVWEASFTLQVDETMFNLDLCRAIVDDAGRKIGWGDFRPQRKGPFGRFIVTKWEELN